MDRQFLQDRRRTALRSEQTQPAWQRYAVSIGSVLLAFAIRFCLGPILGEELPFMLFIAAALVAAWYGGALSGFGALMLGLVLAGYFFMPTAHSRVSSGPIEVLRYFRYIFTASIGITLIEILHRARRRAQAAAEELAQEVLRRKESEVELRAAKALLSKHAEELEQRVAERTEKLKMTIESLQDVLYQIAHNLRAPLRAMEGYSTLLIREYGPVLDDVGKDFSNRISEAARRMDVLIRDLLAYGRLGHTEFPLSKISLDQSLHQAISGLLPEIKRTGAAVEITSKLPEVWGNLIVLEQVLRHLLDNAIKFVAPGARPCIRIWAETRPGAIRLCIQDNGIGIDPRYHQRIFDPFERLLSHNGSEGTGIGLAIVKEGMQCLRGHTGVESQPGHGSLFWLEFVDSPGFSAEGAPK